jgi:hypothetical protein
MSGHLGINMRSRVPLMEAAKAELAAVKDSTLAEFTTLRDKHGHPILRHGHPVRHMIGGHGGWRDQLARWLIQVRADAANQPPAWETPGRPPFVPEAPHLRVTPGIFGFDRGGWLPPRSLTLAYNGLPTAEPVGAAAQPQEVHIHVSVNAPIGSRAELDNWFTQTFDRAARQGRLTYALRRSVSAG